jgi:hypothetical protein
MSKWQEKLWEYEAGPKYRGFTVAKTELTAEKNAIAATGVKWLKFNVKEIPTPGYTLVKDGGADDRTGETGDS